VITIVLAFLRDTKINQPSSEYFVWGEWIIYRKNVLCISILLTQVTQVLQNVSCRAQTLDCDCVAKTQTTNIYAHIKIFKEKIRSAKSLQLGQLRTPKTPKAILQTLPKTSNPQWRALADPNVNVALLD
jgi:hypothetical protein